ncbi:hypothetical protein TVAG_173280 [Trichomonas vaginalis G3]|uniref:F5/8 type C domain-containing protein n=1 Tax=Trichomonas vaginalis (strain ATCC PRA-98 / G3) TaxID=412133 RepID=A2DF78_TRIV3|nr:hypothetical protein TVAG_173280 [Trichomonas vaginalis G3]|eukprot:XP_001582056.1 hypothetical protein [Trichomonas vaginalis G3]
MFFFLRLAYSENTAVFKRAYPDNRIIIYASGSSSQYINDSLQMTKPEFTIDQVEKTYDWCSQCSSSYTDYPWITFSLKDARFHIDKYLLRAGCCYDGCCCHDYGYCERCCLYSWEFQISSDNKTWTTVHKMDRDYSMEYCAEKTFELK